MNNIFHDQKMIKNEFKKTGENYRLSYCVKFSANIF